ncbi:hypothetical protein [Clostridium sp. M14]|nr:hypothetical protein [Clostridium sp. M14]MBZ9693225.1 hypothetical protein [Clostridium sp. M14]
MLIGNVFEQTGELGFEKDNKYGEFLNSFNSDILALAYANDNKILQKAI